MKRYYLIFIAFAIVQFLSGQIETNPEPTKPVEEAFGFEGSYFGDCFVNTTGGIKKGTGYLGMANLCMSFDTETAGLWHGGQFFIHGASTHGDTPSASYIGDLQVASNIEAGDHTYLQELWYSQKIGTTTWTIGLQDLNAEFVVSETGGLFLNSSFGIPSLLSYNVPVPIFPLTTLGITGKWESGENLTILAAIFDGNPTPFEENPYNLGWSINKNDGILSIAEVCLKTQINQLQGSYKAGFFYHSGLNEKDEVSGDWVEVFDMDYGFYGFVDQTIWSHESSGKSLTAFGQISVCPENINTHHYYLGGGFQLNGFLKSDGTDALGLAFAHAGFKELAVKHETTIELSYLIPLTKKLFIQPDFQYIIHPAATNLDVDNAFIAFLRTGISF